MGLPNPYVLLGGGIGALAIAGSIYVQSTMIHAWHVKYDNEHSIVIDLRSKIRGMTDAQNTQTSKSEQNVIKVIQGPKEVQTIIREINNQKAEPCKAPVDSDEVKNAF